MPKDPIRNIDRFKVRGGQLNAFEFHQQQGAISQQEHENWAGGQADEAELPPDQAKAERIRRLLAKHGESVPESAETTQTQETPAPTEDDTMENEPFETSATMPTGAEFDSDESDQSEASAAELPFEPDEETLDEEFAPTHGRSPAVIEEMLQARRATDVVPEPEDVAEGRTGEEARREEAGQPAGAPAAPARPRPRPRKAKAAKAAAAAKPKSAKAKAAPARKAAKKAAAPKGGKKKAAAKSAKKAAAKKGAKPAAKAAAKKGAKPAARKGAKKVTAQKGGKKAAARKSTKKAPARKAVSSKAKARATTKIRWTKPAKKQAKKAGGKRR